MFRSKEKIIIKIEINILNASLYVTFCTVEAHQCRMILKWIWKNCCQSHLFSSYQKLESLLILVCLSLYCFQQETSDHIRLLISSRPFRFLKKKDLSAQVIIASVVTSLITHTILTVKELFLTVSIHRVFDTLVEVRNQENPACFVTYGQLPFDFLTSFDLRLSLSLTYLRLFSFILKTFHLFLSFL